MRIYIEGSSVFKNRSGIGSFAMRLSDAYIKKYPSDELTFFGFKFFSRPLPDFPLPPTNNVRYRIIRWMPGRVYNMLFRLGLGLPLDFFLGTRPNVIIFPNFIRWPVWNRRIKTVPVIHDLSFIYFPQFANTVNLSDTTRFVPKAVAKGSHLITISKSSKKQIIEHYKVPAAKISIVYPGIDPAVFYPRSQADIAKVAHKYHLPKKYLLYHGTLEPRKNIEGLLAAYELLDKKTQDEYPLVLAGGKGWKDEDIQVGINRLRKLGLKVIHTGYLPDDDAPMVISGATMLIFPSHYEGFGMPVVEAMACGVPVIISNNTSLPEIVGEAGILLDKNSPAAIAKAINKLLANPALSKKYIGLGLEQSKKFTWEKSAEQLKAALEKL